MFFYPKCLLPKSRYRYIEINKLNNLSNVIIVRRSEAKSFTETFSRGGVVMQNALFGTRGYKAAQGLSMNVLGGKFKSKHIKFLQRGNSGKLWNPGDRINFREGIKEVIKVNNPIPIYIQLKSIHNISVPYSRPLEGEAKKKLLAFTDKIKNSKVSLKGKTIIEHKPILFNFWHIELALKEDIKLNEDPVKITKSTFDEGREAENQSVGVQFVKHIWETIMISNCKPFLPITPSKISQKMFIRKY